MRVQVKKFILTALAVPALIFVIALIHAATMSHEEVAAMNRQATKDRLCAEMREDAATSHERRMAREVCR